VENLIAVENTSRSKAFPVVNWLLISYLALLAASTLLLWLTVDVHWTGTLISFSPRWLLLVPGGLVLLATLSFRRWRASAALSVGLIAALFFLVGLNLPLLSLVSSTPKGQALRLVSLNADAKALDRDRFNLFLFETDPDVLLIQEARAFQKVEELGLGDWQMATDNGNLRVIARHPVKLLEKLEGGAFGVARGAARFRVDLPNGAFTLVNAHLPTPRDGLEAVMHRAPKALELLQKESDQRGQASQMLVDWTNSAGDLLIAGDFNTPRESRIYQRDWSGWQNAFSQTGWGFGFTMKTRFAAVRIDHILYQKPWSCQSCWLGPDVGSAHRPVVADLILTENP
jgi:vancomycin resistance protein VanJ